MDALGATVGLLLLANLIGLILRLWACFTKFKAWVPTRLVDRKGLLSSFSSTARVRPTALSSLLFEDQRAVVAVSSPLL